MAGGGDDREILRVIAGLDSRWRRSGEAKICDNLRRMTGLSWDAVNVVLVYTPEFTGEPDISPFALGLPESIRRFLLRGYRVTPPTYWYLPVTDDDAAPVHRFNPDSISGERVVALVPALSCDRAGRRQPFMGETLGGFLAEISPTSLTRIGICWSFQLSETPLRGAPELDFIVTEREVIEV
jgi:hypothetical protein